MKTFDYHKPTSLAEAANLLADGNARALAGGHTLRPSMKQRLDAPSAVVDLSGVAELGGEKIREENGAVTVGALARHAEVAGSAIVQKAIPALAKVGVRDRRRAGSPSRGTIGGSLANNDPAADYPAAVLGLGATVRTNRREIGADDFFTGLFSTALEAGEVIVSVSFPAAEKAGYAKFPQPASLYALTGVFVAKTKSEVRVAVTGRGRGRRFPREGMGGAAGAGFFREGAGGREGSAGGIQVPDQRHPRLGGIPRLADGDDGEAGDGGLICRRGNFLV